MYDLDNTFGILAAIISGISHIFYVIAILKGYTKPSRITWFIWSILGIILATAYYHSGATSTIWFPIAEAIFYITIAVLSIKYGVGGWTKIDKIALAGAVITGLLWYVSGSALVGLISALIIDFMAVIPTIYKSFLHPSQEDKKAWLLTCTASILNLIAINEWSFSIAIYPLYMLAMNSIITTLLFRPDKTM